MNKNKRIRPIEEYTEDIGQNWTKSTYAGTYTDQFGFCIEYGNKYSLYFHGEFLIKVHSLKAAKEISRIYLNDKILHVHEEVS